MSTAILYCICRSSASDRFMIQCDKCEEWFHGDCVRVSQTEGNRINNYFCATCQEKDPSLKITYKSTKKRPSEKKSRKSAPKKEAKRPASPAATAPQTPEAAPAGGSNGGPASGSPTESDAEDDEDWEAGGEGRKGAVSRASVEVNGLLGAGTAPRKGGKSKSKSKGKSSHSQPGSPKKTPVKKSPVKTAARQGYDNHKHPRSLTEVENALVHGIPPPLPVPPEVGGHEPAFAGSDAKKKAVKKPRTPVKPATPPHVDEEETRDFTGFDKKNMKQCLGPKCCFAAAPNSKYCSEECGRSLAAKRLMTIMPQRLEQFGQHMYAATLLNQKDMDGIRKKLADCKVMLEKLQARKANLEATIRVGKETPPADDQEAEEDNVKDTVDSSIICITCGRYVSIRTALKHFEGCSNKLENQTSYGSAFITATSSNIFCDTLNPKTMTYCKRLKVICPEHFKEAVDEHDVCGFPLSDEKSTTKGEQRFCSLLKKNCSKHPSWERIKQAEIDLETLRTWIKMDELVEQERMIMLAIQSRGGIFHCMSNYTLPIRPAPGPALLDGAAVPRERRHSKGSSPVKAIHAAS